MDKGRGGVWVRTEDRLREQLRVSQETRLQVRLETDA